MRVLLKMAHRQAEKFEYLDASALIERTADKTKSTEGGIRAHLLTLGLSPDFDEIDDSVDVYIILDDITTPGSSLEAVKQGYRQRRNACPVCRGRESGNQVHDDAESGAWSVIMHIE